MTTRWENEIARYAIRLMREDFGDKLNPKKPSGPFAAMAPSDNTMGWPSMIKVEGFTKYYEEQAEKQLLAEYTPQEVDELKSTS